MQLGMLHILNKGNNKITEVKVDIRELGFL
jgi:hypothetical protein